MGLDHADDDIDAFEPPLARLGRASRRSCRRPAPRPGNLQPAAPFLPACCSRASGDGRSSAISAMRPSIAQPLIGLHGIQRHIELQHIDMRLADEAERRGLRRAPRPAGGPASPEIPRALATRGTWKSAPAGVMSGSRPLADVVTRSTGTGVFGIFGLQLRRIGLDAGSISALDVGPRLEPDELAAS